MTSIRPPSDDVQAEAAAWLVRLQSERRTEADAQAFRQWLVADPSHSVSFEAVTTAWDISGGLPRDLRGISEVPAGNSRRKVMAGAATLIAGTGAFGFWRSAQAQTYQTEVGEQKHVSLDDGTRIFLDTDTRLHVRFNTSQRSAVLQQGRVNFRTVSDSVRPFVVSAATSRIIASPSNMDVRLDGSQLSVVLVNGSVEVLRSAVQPEKLQSGDRLVISADGVGRRDRPVLLPLLAWQTGQAIFENGRLADAVREMNRYSNVKLRIADPEAGELRVSGIYSVGDNVAFATSVAKLLPVKLMQGESQIEIVPDRNRKTPG